MTIETARRASLEFVCVLGQDGVLVPGTAQAFLMPIFPQAWIPSCAKTQPF